MLLPLAWFLLSHEIHSSTPRSSSCERRHPRENYRLCSVKVTCPADMNPVSEFAAITTGQSLFHAGIEPGFTNFYGILVVKYACIILQIPYFSNADFFV